MNEIEVGEELFIANTEMLVYFYSFLEITRKIEKLL